MTFISITTEKIPTPWVGTFPVAFKSDGSGYAIRESAHRFKQDEQYAERASRSSTASRFIVRDRMVHIALVLRRGSG
jgi:hypothetical protein